MSHIPENTPLTSVFLRNALAKESLLRKYVEAEQIAILLMSRAVNQLHKGFKTIESPELRYVTHAEEQKRTQPVFTPLAVAFLATVRRYEDILQMKLERRTFLEQALQLMSHSLPLAFGLQRQNEELKRQSEEQKKIMKPTDTSDVFLKVKITGLSMDELQNAWVGANDLAAHLFQEEKDVVLKTIAPQSEAVGKNLHEFFLHFFLHSEKVLPPRQLQALLLFFSFNGSPRLKSREMYHYVSKELGLEIAWVESLVAEGIKRLRQSIKL